MLVKGGPGKGQAHTAASDNIQGPVLLTRSSFNPSKDKQLHPL